MVWVNGKAGEEVNGQVYGSSLPYYMQHLFNTKVAGCVDQTDPPVPTWDRNSNNAPNTIRLGEVSSHGTGNFPRNYSGDMTVDEFTLWRINAYWSDGDPNSFQSNATAINQDTDTLFKEVIKTWRPGRFYRPSDDAVFTSGPIHPPKRKRTLTPSGSNQGTITSASGNAGAGVQRGGLTVAESARPTKILGMSWTWYAEDYSRKDGSPLVLDHRGPDVISGAGGGSGGNGKGGSDSSSGGGGGFNGGPVGMVCVKGNQQYSTELGRVGPIVLRQEPSMCAIVLRVVNASGVVMRELAGEGFGFTDAGYTALTDPVTGVEGLAVQDGEALQYQVRFNIEGLQMDSILLASPAFDDITFYFSNGEADYLSWRVVNTTL